MCRHRDQWEVTFGAWKRCSVEREGEGHSPGGSLSLRHLETGVASGTVSHAVLVTCQGGPPGPSRLVYTSACQLPLRLGARQDGRFSFVFTTLV